MMATVDYEYDEDTVAGFIDATCDFQSIETEFGPSDDHGTFPAATCTISLANPHGDWSQYNSDGSSTNHGPGYPLAVWAHYNDGSGDWWMFYGTITSWNDLGDHVEIEAVDEFANLAQPIGTYTPGTNGQSPQARITSILAAAGRSALRTVLAAGDVTLTAQATTQAPLEEIQTVVASDGAAFFGDADGTLVSTRRTWRQGRTDQDTFPVISDNVCTATVVTWDAVLSNNDDNVADTVILENVAKLKAQAPVGTPGRFLFTETGQQWTTQVEGDSLASFLWAAQQTARINVAEFDLYLNDPKQAALYQAVEWRLFDVVRFLHDFPAADGLQGRLDVNMLVQGINHSIVADGSWIMSVATTKALGGNLNNIWNPPDDPYYWDAPGVTWGF